MSSPQKSAITRRYSPRYSNTIVLLEVFFHVLVFIAILQILSGWWLFGILLLFVLIAVNFFHKQSIRTEFPPGCGIEIRHNPPRLIWYDRQNQREYSEHETRCIMTRWFVLLQLGTIGRRKNKLLLMDSFEDKTHYTRLRRELIEMTLC